MASTNKLTDTQVKAAKPREKQYRLADGNRMALVVMPNGTKAWRLDYEHAGKRKTAALGTYPSVSLTEARKLRTQTRELISAGIDPIEHRRESDREAIRANEVKTAAGITFTDAITDWLARMRTGQSHNVATNRQAKPWSPSTFDAASQRITFNLTPFLGTTPLVAVSKDSIDDCLQRMLDRGSNENARKTMILIRQFYRDERVCEIVGAEDSMRKIGRSVPPKKRRPKNHAAAVTPDDLTPVLRLIDTHKGSLVVHTALQITPHLMLRPVELRHLRWQDVHLKDKQLVIPADRIGHGDDMPEGAVPQRGLKSGDVDLVVPLSRQALALLKTVYKYTGNGGYVFPSGRSNPDAPVIKQRPLSENTINSAMRSVGIDKTMQSAHGFRATARTMLRERLQIDADIIECQLAHSRVDEYGNAYARTEFIEQRINMMQQWSDYLDRLRAADTNVVPLRA